MIEPPQAAYTYNAEVTGVTDGDTLKVRVDLGFQIEHRIAVRLADVFAAERNEPAGGLHTAQLRAMLPVGTKVTLVTRRLRGAEVSTFGRYVADVWCDGQHINEEMRRQIGAPQGAGVK